MKKLLILLTIFPNLTFAANCVNPENSDETLACLNKQTQTAKIQLANAIYKTLDRFEGEDKKNFIAAQRLWVQYKEADCNFISSFVGKADRILVKAYKQQCANERAIQRAIELNSMFKESYLEYKKK
ncbi:lysozyme inhibitor LprI family protein [Snodgrassella gandavensis]|uniref:lysozyme inhibitor LprI family protein n=1 Tax=Snodgrassella gandavensis TaxID=2946698 RepID=UPI001EF60040|nr:lysozyme inhibitor LprI family protein [Snodgrassella gandavensis]